MTTSDNPTSPRISVIVPCFNAGRFLPAAVESVIRQSFIDWELLIIDDGSSDGSGAVADQLARLDPRVTAHHQANGGVARARNLGVQCSSSSCDYFLFLDADDELEPSMLGTLVTHLDRRPEASIAHCLVNYIDETGQPATPDVPRLQPRWAPTRFWMRKLSGTDLETPFVTIFCAGAILPSAAVIRRRHYQMTKGWDESIGQPTEDIELYLDLALRSEIHFVPERLVRYRLHPQQSTVANPDHFSRQVRKLYARWSDYHDRPGREQEVIRAAIRFKQRRYDILLGLRNARAELASRRYVRAARAVLGPTRKALQAIMREAAGQPPTLVLPPDQSSPPITSVSA